MISIFHYPYKQTPIYWFLKGFYQFDKLEVVCFFFFGFFGSSVGDEKVTSLVSVSIEFNFLFSFHAVLYTARGFDVGFPDLFRKKRHSADFIFKRNARSFDNIFMYYTTYVRKCKEKRQKLLPVRDHSEPDSQSSIMNTVPSQIVLLRSFCGSDCRLYNKTPSDRSLFFTNPNEISRKNKLCGVFAESFTICT